MNKEQFISVIRRIGRIKDIPILSTFNLEICNVTFLSALLKALELNRFPKWVDKIELKKIRIVYLNAYWKNKKSNDMQYHVDHKIPLQGKQVSGLHVVENLRVIPARDNIKKWNNFEIS